MNYNAMREELKNFYYNVSDKNANEFCEACKKKLDALYTDGMSVYDMKLLQYKVISEDFKPIVFEHCPFYYETGVVGSHSDGAREFRGRFNAAGWTYWKGEHKFIDQDPELWALKDRQKAEIFYLVGDYNDTAQHFQFNYRPVFEHGFKGVYEEAKRALDNAEDAGEREFLGAVCEGILTVKRISEKFAERAEELLKTFPDNENYKRIAESAKRCPWEKPESFYEALNTLAFMRKVIGALEGVGPNTFGRVDMDLYPFYEKDIKTGKITEEEAYELIAKFLVTFDCHYDHDMKMIGYADHELENTYVLGGCDDNGKPLYNELTKMFLLANSEEKVIFPKIICRFSKNSPKEYFDIINTPIINGTSTIIYQNDDAVIPALVRSGRTLSEARDYILTGCWGLFTNCNDCRDDASYINLLRVFEYQIHNLTDKMKEVNMYFKPIDDAKSFEEVYKTTLENIDVLLKERTRVITKGGNIWNTVDVLPVLSSTFVGCLENKKDFTAAGSKYKDDSYVCVGFPNVIDSLLAIKKLCFEDKKYTLGEMLAAVRCNWEGYEDMRLDAIRTAGWGDGSEESCALAARFNTDLYNLLSEMKGIHGGKIHLGHQTYTEIRFWGEKTRATPDGRRNGDYFSQGLTPSRLKKIPYVTSVINSMASLNKTELAGNNVINVILPSSNTTLDVCEAFLRSCADSAVESLQLNCTSKETLLDAQKHPEKYPDLIVRVCGFSAKFTSLSPEWQKEVISRNFYE